MSRNDNGYGPRAYPHGSGDRNTKDSSNILDSAVATGGRQKKPAVDPAAAAKDKPPSATDH